MFVSRKVVFLGSPPSILTKKCHLIAEGGHVVMWYVATLNTRIGHVRSWSVRALWSVVPLQRV